MTLGDTPGCKAAKLNGKPAGICVACDLAGKPNPRADIPAFKIEGVWYCGERRYSGHGCTVRPLQMYGNPLTLGASGCGAALTGEQQ